MNRVGLHIIGGTSLALGKPRVVKLVDVSPEYVRQVRGQVGPGCLIIVRWIEAQANWLGRGPQAWFDAYLGQMRAMADGNVAFESLNEVPDEQARAYAQFEAERLRLMHGAGLRSVVGNWSVGCPDVPVWAIYQPALDAMNDGDLVGLHEYWADGADLLDPGHWHAGRFMRPEVRPYLENKRIVITECGRDYIPDIKRGRPGWKLTCSAPEFYGDLEIYNQWLCEPNIVGAAVFTVGGPGWEAFDPAPIWDSIVSRYGEEVTVPEKGIVLAWPIRHGQYVSQSFGEHAVDYSPFPGHNGTDMGCPVGTVIRAMHAGKAYHGNPNGPYRAYGVHLWVKGEHEGETYWTMLAHLSRILIDDGEMVEAGNVVALSGNTGRSTGPHLHIGIETPAPVEGYRDQHDPGFWWADPEELLG